MIRTYSVAFSARAQRDASVLLRMIADDRGTAVAVSYVERLRAYCLGFRTFPHRGHPCSDFYPGLRAVGFERRVTVYFRIVGDRVIIERLLYAGRQP